MNYLGTQLIHRNLGLKTQLMWCAICTAILSTEIKRQWFCVSIFISCVIWLCYLFFCMDLLILISTRLHLFDVSCWHSVFCHRGWQIWLSLLRMSIVWQGTNQNDGMFSYHSTNQWSVCWLLSGYLVLHFGRLHVLIFFDLLQCERRRADICVEDWWRTWWGK